MNSLVPANTHKAPAIACASLLGATVKYLPLLLLVQVISNPIAGFLLYGLVRALLPGGGESLWSLQIPRLQLLIFPIYWAFLAGGANIINLAIARGEPVKLSMLLSRRHLVRRYLTVTLIVFIWAALCGAFSNLIYWCLSVVSKGAPIHLIAIPAASIPWFWFCVKCGFIDISIVDKNLGAFAALKDAGAVTVGNFWKVFGFYLFVVASVTGLYFLLSWNNALLQPTLFVCLLAITAANFWRVKLYCYLGTTAKAIEAREQANRIGPLEQLR
jgi:hypothetical protein